MNQEQVKKCSDRLSTCVGSEVRVTPDVSQAISSGGILPGVGAAEGELGLAFLWCGRVFGNKLHDMWVVLIAADAAFADDVHDAGEHVSSAAAEPSAA